MIARILLDDGYYDSIVFAIYNKGWSSEVLVFNKGYTTLQFVKIWIPDRNVYIYNADKQDWVTKRKTEGYDWVLENVTRKFFKTKINEFAILDKCKALQTTFKDCEWFDLKNETDVEGLMYASCDFHDSYVKKMYIDGAKQYIHFDTTWGCEILFELDGSIKTNLFKDYGHIAIDDDFPIIFDSTIIFENDLIYWVEDFSIKKISEIQEAKAHYFCAKNVKWKLIINDSTIWGKMKS